jgi:hypothetical protein
MGSRMVDPVFYLSVTRPGWELRYPFSQCLNVNLGMYMSTGVTDWVPLTTYLL